MATQKTTHKKGGIWFLIIPVLIIAVLLISRKFESSDIPSQRVEPNNIATLEPSLPEPVDRFDTMAHTVFIIKDSTCLYNQPDEAYKTAFYLFYGHKIIYTNSNNDFVYIESIDEKGIPYKGWILRNDVGKKVKVREPDSATVNVDKAFIYSDTIHNSSDYQHWYRDETITDRYLLRGQFVSYSPLENENGKSDYNYFRFNCTKKDGTRDSGCIRISDVTLKEKPFMQIK